MKNQRDGMLSRFSRSSSIVPWTYRSMEPTAVSSQRAILRSIFPPRCSGWNLSCLV